ncbi:hypothetical protein ACOSQ4_009140 [Xanthoceras sorbifolium]
MMSSSTIHQGKYDVFLSFRGEDTRDSFTSHLYAALRQKQIETFMDNQLIKGNEISPSLLNAIEESQISVIIFSKDYASSRWCLEELVEILKCKNMHRQIVIPVFYQVNPSDIRNQTGTFADAFAKHEQRFKDSVDMLQRWRAALKETANLSGWDSLVIKPDSLLVEKIVQDVLKRLNDMSPVDDNSGLVGVNVIRREIELLLCNGSKHFCMVGIWGIGGIGKTTVAGALFNKMFDQFEGSYFIQNVREESEKHGLIRWQQEVFSTILEDGSLNIGTSVGRRSNFIKKRLGRKKILIVFDDVTDSRQIESFIKDSHLFCFGSRIIITTRDKHVLTICGANEVYELRGLFEYDALQLFNRYAFGRNHPAVDYKELSNKLVKYANGVPLALKVLGSFLLGRRKHEWESALNKLERIPHKDIQNVLKINIFLDIACFFKGEDKDLVRNIQDANGLSAEIGMSVLIDKSLIIVSDNTITMHDLLQEMGREIIRQESIKHPGKRSRLWYHEDIYHVLTKNMGTGTIVGISLNMSTTRDIQLHPRAFVKMQKLRFLRFYISDYRENSNNKNKVHVSQDGFECFFTELSYLHWYGCPLKSLQSNFHSENLVILEMPNSTLEELWSDVLHLDNLKSINLKGSQHLIRCPDLSGAGNLESLMLGDCTSLSEIPSSIQHLNKLKSMYLDGYVHIKPDTFSKMHKLRFLKFYSARNGENDNKVHAFQGSEYVSDELRYLHWHNCPLRSLQSNFNPENLVVLNMPHSNVEQLWNGGQQLPNLKEINLEHSKHLTIFPDLFGAVNLESLNLQGCTNLLELPVSIQCLNNLKVLKLTNCKSLEALPNCSGLESLRQLDLMGCSNVKTLSGIPYYCENDRRNKVHVSQGLESFFTELIYLHWYGCPLKSLQSNFYSKNLVILEMPNSCLEELWSGVPQLYNLKSIDLGGSQQLIRCPDLSGAPNLESLMLTECTSLSEIPSSIQHLNKVQSLYLYHCKSLVSIPDCTGLKSLEYLFLDHCSKLKRLPQLPKNLKTLSSSECSSLVEIPSSVKHLSKLEYLNFSCCKSLTSIPDLRGLKSLKEFILRDTQVEELPSSLENLDSFVHIDLIDCSRLQSLPSSICKWKSVHGLYLTNCSKIDKLPDDIGTLESLQMFDARGTAIREVPPSISCLKRLHSLSFSGCKGEDGVGLLLPSLLGLDNLKHLNLSNCGIRELPDTLGCLTSLRTLHLDRNNFESISGSIVNLSQLYSLDISYCERLKVLPELHGTTISAVNCTSLEVLSNFSFQNDIFVRHMKADFTNCFKLDRNVYEGVSPPVYICYPESEIPEWFSYQSKGSFIDVKLPPYWLDYKFLCFAVCVVVSVPYPNHQRDHHGDDNYSSYSNILFECNVKSRDGDRRVVIEYGNHRSLRVAYSGFDYIRSNHLFIGFGFHFFRELCDTEFSFRFYVKNENELNTEYCKVEKCGVHFMFAQHLEDEPHSDEIECLEASDESSDQEEDETTQKRLKQIEYDRGETQLIKVNKLLLRMS